jgi:hypothetical protein
LQNASQYVIVDQECEKGPLRVIGYRYEPSGYIEIPANAQGCVLLNCVGLFLGVRGLDVVLYEVKAEREIEDYETLLRRAQEDAAARRLAENRLRELEAELKRLRGE